MFLGQSILQYKYNPQFEAAQTTTEQLELVFQVDQGATNNMILVFIVSERLVILTQLCLVDSSMLINWMVSSVFFYFLFCFNEKFL